MKFYIGVNSDGTCFIAKQKIKRYIDYETNAKDVLSYQDTQMPPHWMLDYEGINVPKYGDMPIGKYMVFPEGAIKKMFDIDMTWEDDCKEIEL